MEKKIIIGVLIALVIAVSIVPIIMAIVGGSTGTTLGNVVPMTILNGSIGSYNYSSTYNTTQGGIVASDFNVYNSTDLSGAPLTVLTEYNLTNGQLDVCELLGAALGNCADESTCASVSSNFSYYSESYIESSTIRTVYGMLPIIIVIGLLLTVGFGMGIIQKFK